MKRLVAVLALLCALTAGAAAAQLAGCKVYDVIDPESGQKVGEFCFASPTPPAVTPTSTSTPTAPPTSTATVQSTPTLTAVSTATPTATPRPTVAPTATPAPQLKGLPARSSDGTYYIVQPGVYSFDASCSRIGANAYCVHAWGPGITLQDYSIVTEQGSALQFDSGHVSRRGRLTALLGSGAFGFNEADVLFEDIDVDVAIGGIGMGGAGCENASPRPNRNVTIRDSSFVNDGGTEMIWIKCGQDILIEGSYFLPSSAWSVSTPDGVNVRIVGNTFDLSAEPTNWLAVELPRVFGATVGGNRVGGPAGDWFVYVNSGTRDLVLTDNCVMEGVGILHDGHQPGGVINLTSERNGACLQPPTTGDGGLK